MESEEFGIRGPGHPSFCAVLCLGGLYRGVPEEFWGSSTGPEKAGVLAGAFVALDFIGKGLTEEGCVAPTALGIFGTLFPSPTLRYRSGQTGWANL